MDKQAKRQAHIDRIQRRRSLLELSKQARFYDELLASGKSKYFDKLGKNAVVIDINNAATLHDREIPATLDESARPPFDVMFLEHNSTYWKYRSGMLAVFVDDDSELSQFPRVDTEYKYGIFCVMFLSTFSTRQELAHGFIYLRDDYHLVRMAGAVVDSVPLSRVNDAGKVIMAGLELTAYTLMKFNSHQTELVTHAPSAESSQQFEREFGVPLTIYKTLSINPTRKIYDGASEHESQRHSAPREHIVRGHYRKVEAHPFIPDGTYWIPAHVRGDEQRGMVVKDYEVEAP